jgi:capsular exopolysaccharide synthesis family protein
MNQGSLDLRDYVEILRRRKWTIAAIAVTTIAAALFFSRDQKPEYSSSAQVLVKAPRFDPTQPSAAYGFVNMKTEGQVANSPTVSQIAFGHLADRGIQPGTATALVPSDTETIQFTSVSSDPAVAQATAQAYAEAYLEFRSQDVRHDLEAIRDELDRQLSELDSQLKTTAEQVEHANSAAQATLLTARYTGLLNQRGTILVKRTELPTANDLHVGNVLQNAEFPTSPSGGSRRNTILLGILGGLALGVSVALLRDRLDEGVRGREELELHTRAPVLAFIPRLPSPGRSLMLLTQPSSEGAEAYKNLRVRLMMAAERRGVRSMLVTSSVAGEGKTSTTANLGVALAQMGKSVVLISGDLRRPTLHEYFPAANGAGLTEVLEGKKKLQDALSGTGISDLWVLHPGSTLALADQLDRLASPAMKELLERAKKAADIVLVDAPPILSASETTALASFTDGVLLVSDPRRVHTSTIQQARLELEMIGAEVIGVVVNNYDPRRFQAYARYRYPYSPDQTSTRAQPGLPGIVETRGIPQAEAEGGADARTDGRG